MLSLNTATHIAGAIVFAAVAGIGIARDTVRDLRVDPGGANSVASAAVDCPECSDRKKGYDWAASEKISSLEACGNAPWEFRQGCDDYLADMRGT